MFIRTPFLIAAVACASIAGPAFAQQSAPASQTGSADITGIPPARGVYYRANSGWVALSPTVLMPLSNGRAPALEVLNVGSDHADSQIPGTHSSIQISNDARPTFYLHGISPNELNIVRAVTKRGYRELQMHESRHFWEWAQYRDRDVTDFDIEAVNGDIVVIKPSADLKPGEYALAVPAGADYQWMRFGFDFGIAGSR